MLVLTRKKGQSLMIGQDVEIAVIDVQGDQVRLGIIAPKSIPIHRKEIFDEIKQENREASSVTLSTESVKKAMESVHMEKKQEENHK